MKKIVLGCAAVLLSLGLLAGCNNEEDEPPIVEAVSLSVSQTSVDLEPGGSAEVTYTVDPADATVMALSDHEEYVTAVAQEGTIYLEAVAAGSAIVSVGAEYEDYASAEAQITVTVLSKEEEDTGPGPDQGGDGDDEGGDTGTTEPGEQVITLSGVPETLDVALDGEATITPVATPAGAVIEYVIEEPSIVSLTNTAAEEGEYEFTVTPLVEGTTNIVFTASLEDEDYEDVTATTAVTVHESGWEPDTGSEPNPDPETVTTRSNYTVNFYFVDAETITQYYSIPEYSDAYVNGYITDEETWNDYEIGGFGALTEKTDDSVVCYTITFETILTGNRGYQICLEFNSKAQNHTPATTPTWDHKAYEGYFEVSDNEEVTSTDVYMVCDPSEHISDDASFVELTVAIKNTSSTGFTSGLQPQFYHWVTNDNPESTYVNMTQGACGTYTTATDYYFTVKADGTTTDGSNHTYRIDQGAEFKFQIACSGGTNEWSESLMFAENPWTNELPVSSYNGDITIDEGYLAYDSVLLVLELDFSAYQTMNWNEDTDTLFNHIITNVAAYPNWEVA